METKEELEFLEKQYEFIVSQWTEYFKLYMQSWSIVISGIIIGTLFSFKLAPQATHTTRASSGEGDALLALSLGIIPVLMLIWFLLTCWFWALFDTYRRRAKELEGQIRKRLLSSMRLGPALHTIHGEECFGGYRIYYVWLGWQVILSAGVYLAISYRAAQYISAGDEYLWLYLGLYLAGLVVSLLVGWICVMETDRLPKVLRRLKSSSIREGCPPTGREHPEADRCNRD